MSKDSIKTVKVFVYGTLKVGEALSTGLDGHRILCEEATTRGVLYRGPRYPLLIRSASPLDIVSGELHTYPIEALALLDMIEGFNYKNKKDSLFIREKIPIYIKGNSSTKPESVFAYLWKRPLKTTHYPIIGGVWDGSPVCTH